MSGTAKTAEGGAESWPDPREDGAVPDIYMATGQTAENLALQQFGLETMCVGGGQGMALVLERLS
jgi:acetyl-CoA acetyltransferase